LLTAVLAVLITVFGIGSYWTQDSHLQKELSLRKANTEKAFYQLVARESSIISSVINLMITSNNNLQTSFAQRDREALSSLLQPIMDELGKHKGVIHLEFLDTDFNSLLHLHDPNHSSRRNDWKLISKSQLGGKDLQYIEMGPTGMLTLRIRSPWFDGDRLIGYVELGMAINNALLSLQELINTKLFIVANKGMFDRMIWELSLPIQTNRADWSRYPGFLLIGHTADTDLNLLDGYFEKTNGPHLYSLTLKTGDSIIYLDVLPLSSALGEEIVSILIAHDISAEWLVKSKLIKLALGTAFIALLLLGLFHLILSRVETQLISAERERDDFAKRSRVDGLTSLFNRAEFYRLLKRELKRARHEGAPVAIVMLDLDHFKAINDTYGHLVGDEVLQTAADIISQGVRPGDHVARYGGEEFAMLLPGIDVIPAVEIAERVRERLAESTIDVKNGSIKVTTSGGAAAFPKDGDNPTELVAAADQALYIAKYSGRNCVISYREDIDDA